MRRVARRGHCDVAFGLARRHDDECVDESTRVDTRREKSRLGPLRTTRCAAAVWQHVDALGDGEGRCVGSRAGWRVAAVVVARLGNGHTGRTLMMVFVFSSSLLVPNRSGRDRRMMPRRRTQQRCTRQHHARSERQCHTDDQAGGTSRRGRHDSSIAGHEASGLGGLGA